MTGFVTLIMLGAVAAAQLSVADAKAQVEVQESALRSISASVDLPALPPAPPGKSTILGGEIRSVDPVRDQLTLRVFGQRPVKILFDERTQVYLDGKAIRLDDLRPAAHASVQTVLDGTDVYALSIHMLSQSPEGEYRGRVLKFNPDTHELTVSSLMYREPIKLLVPVSTPVARVGQPGFCLAQPGAADLVRGALISVKFESDKNGRGIASQIAVLATPGAAFVFVGNLTALDMHSGRLVLVDPADEQSYPVSFDSRRLSTGRNLHLGDHVMVTANFDGSRYVASAITVN